MSEMVKNKLQPLAFLIPAALVLFCTGWRAERIQASPATDDAAGSFWTIGRPDGLSDEFAPGAAPELTYEIGRSTPRDWRARQDAQPGRRSTYRIRFLLADPPAFPPVLAIDCFFLNPAPAGIEIQLNGKRGYYRVRPVYAEDVDSRQAMEAAYSRQAFRIPLPPELLRRGMNEIGISLDGEDGSLQYDDLSLLKSTAPVPELSAAVEPTVFFRSINGGLKEITGIVVRHQKPLAELSADLRIGGARISGRAKSDGYDFGEQAIELQVPATAPAPYALDIAAGQKLHLAGEFHPEKRWRIFAALRIHNDNGFTDLQPNVRELDARNADGVAGIASRFPFYRFNFETGWLLDNYIHSRSAATVKRLMDLAAAGRVSVNAIYLNLLTGLCTGEELYRSVYFSKSLETRYGVPVKSACLTDVPTPSWFLPSLLRDIGINYFASGGNQARSLLLAHSHLNEESPFYWEGADGRRVLAWFARNYRQVNRLAGDKPTIDRLRRSVPQFLARYRRSDYPVDAVMLYGLYGDNKEIHTGDAAIFQAWNQMYAFPKIVPATDADYFDYVSRHFASRLPVFRGDAGAAWEDGAGSSAAETACNRDTQRMLPQAEAAAALATAFQPSQLYPAQEFRDAWKNVLFYDEHTWGSSLARSQPDRDLVREQWEIKRGYARHGHEAASNLMTRSLNRLAQNISTGGPTLFVFNLGTEARTDLVEAEMARNQRPVDLATGKPVPLDVIDQKPGYRTVRFMAEHVPALGYKAYAIGTAPAPGAPQAGQEAHPTWQIESRYYRIEFDPQSGAIRQIHDKEIDRDLVDAAAGHGMNELLYVAGGENTTIIRDIAPAPPRLDITGQSGAALIEKVHTPFGERIRIRARSTNVPSIETEVSVYDGLKRIDIVNSVHKNEVMDREAVYFAFPFAIARPEIAYEIQNAWVRPNVDQLPGAPRDWFATQNAVAVWGGPPGPPSARSAPAGGDGLAIVWASPDAPLITLTDINRGRWRRSLDLKNGYIYSYVMNNYWSVNYRASQGGDFRFRYFISSARAFGKAEQARFSDAARSPLVTFARNDSTPASARMPLAEGQFFKVDGCDAELTALKQAEDGNGMILRLHELAGEAGSCRVESPVFPLRQAWLANGVERPVAPLATAGNIIRVPLMPHRFVSVRLLFQGGQARDLATR